MRWSYNKHNFFNFFFFFFSFFLFPFFRLRGGGGNLKREFTFILDFYNAIILGIFFKKFKNKIKLCFNKYLCVCVCVCVCVIKIHISYFV
jgi:hypothetical protein